ncbi:hypothetical protein AB9F29_21275, partial [Falsihalocynthiibacter sp. S25ZX9]
KSFEKRVDAKDWAARQEFLIREGEVSGSTETMRDALLRYAREVSPSKRGAKWEQLRPEKIAKGSLGDVALRNVQPIDLANWRDMRLREVAAGTVNREMTLLSGVFSIARKRRRDERTAQAGRAQRARKSGGQSARRRQSQGKTAGQKGATKQRRARDHHHRRGRGCGAFAELFRIQTLGGRGGDRFSLCLP